MRDMGRIMRKTAAFILIMICATLLLKDKNAQAAKDYTYSDKPEYGTLSNGSTGYYIKDNALYKYTYKNKKVKKLKNLNKKLYLYLSAAYGKNIYMTSENFDKWSLKTYYYNTKTKKVKYAKAKVSITSNSGQYAITQDEFRSDVSPFKTSLYKLTNSGMKKIKTLTKHGMSAHFINNKIYYADYPLDGKDDGAGMSQLDIYVCDKNGDNPKLLGTVKDETEYGTVYVLKMKAGYCEVMMTDGNYRFTYDTQQLKKIK